MKEVDIKHRQNVAFGECSTKNNLLSGTQVAELKLQEAARNHRFRENYWQQKLGSGSGAPRPIPRRV